MHHPFEKIPPSLRKRTFWLLFIFTLLLMFIFTVTGAPLNTASAPYGVVSYELAGSTARAQAILASWDQKAQLIAAFGLGLDYLFMLAYSTTIGLGCIWAGEVLQGHKWPLARLGVALAWLLGLAASLDAVENMALMILILGNLASPWPELARWCATGKFTLIFAGLVYAFLGLAVHLAGRLTAKVQV